MVNFIPLSTSLAEPLRDSRSRSNWRHNGPCAVHLCWWPRTTPSFLTLSADIAWRAIMSVLDIPPHDWEQKQDCLTRAIEAEKREEIGDY